MINVSVTWTEIKKFVFIIFPCFQIVWALIAENTIHNYLKNFSRLSAWNGARAVQTAVARTSQKIIIIINSTAYIIKQFSSSQTLILSSNIN